MNDGQLWDAAVAVLRENDLGGWTKPAPALYPYQWSWDSAFIAIGLVHVDPLRAVRELETLFAAQWQDGRVPHIVFTSEEESPDYFPDAGWWGSQQFSPPAPAHTPTSGLVQPPVHAIAAWHIAQLAGEPVRERLHALYPRLLAWHRYLATQRDPAGRGLVVVYHPWESMDNSPRFDGPLARVQVGSLPPYRRRDTAHIPDASQRPSDAEYDRFLWLVKLLKDARYDDAEAQRRLPLLVADVFFSSIFAAANQALLRLGTWLGITSDRTSLDRWADRFATAVQGQWDASSGLALDRDLRADRPIHVQTCAGLAPLLVPGLAPRLRDALVSAMFGPHFAGAEGFRFRVIPSSAPGSAGFDRRRYWRGPTWPVINWLFWWALRQQGEAPRAEALRQANLDLLRQPGSRFAEYLEPYTGEALGSTDQSWTAAVALDWLAANGSA
ncbi:MAG: glycogen debranching protein [Chloroflexi bacterium]|nr:glycogen debranching protein [Chloroflexota bacterium]